MEASSWEPCVRECVLARRVRLCAHGCVLDPQVAVAGIGFGKLVWEVEQRYGESEPRAWMLHVVWHVLSCIGGYSAIMHNFYLRKEKLGPHKKSA